MTPELPSAQRPWLSVVMPVFNGADTLAESIASVALQAEGIELVLVDQASDDASVAIAKSFADRIDIRIVSNPESSGWMENTNLAMSMARAPFATMLHQDDYWHEDRAAVLKAMLETYSEAALWVHGADYVDDRSHRIGTFAPPFGARRRLVPSAEAFETLIVQDTIALPAVVFRTSDYRMLAGLDETLWMTADWDLWLKLIGKGPLAWTHEKLVAFRLHRASLTLKGSRKLEDYRDQLDRALHRHLDTLAEAERARLEPLARSSNAINFWLASRYHAAGASISELLRIVLSIGPRRWGEFLRKTQLLQRVVPRLRLRKKK
ncbi:glycosyltransferase [Roseovarius faecimaris]|uniref:Glycosyltransferase n=1 Tax=Roseovarius faecimaris TaxID=2494550 RepID=A0A6I6IMU7_9RHOB|nr:glycosyltransferase [Roseovarius faecimaris]QGX98349.1 glycosyltransferase [Roseovarius faecimaris]